MMQTGADFKQFWKKNRIYQYEVARAADVSEYTLVRWLRDLRPERLARVQKATDKILLERGS